MATLLVATPVGRRVLVLKDENRRQTKSGIHLPDGISIPTITGVVLEVSREVKSMDPYHDISKGSRVLFNPNGGIPVDFETDMRRIVIPVENIVAVLSKEVAVSAELTGGGGEKRGDAD